MHFQGRGVELLGSRENLFKVGCLPAHTRAEAVRTSAPSSPPLPALRLQLLSFLRGSNVSFLNAKGVEVIFLFINHFGELPIYIFCLFFPLVIVIIYGDFC